MCNQKLRLSKRQNLIRIEAELFNIELWVSVSFEHCRSLNNIILYNAIPTRFFCIRLNNKSVDA